MKKLMCTALIGAGVAFSGVAAANEYAVSFSQDELVSYEGVGQVHARIVETAKDYCPTYAEVRSVSTVRACVNDVVADLVSKVNDPLMTAYHNGDLEPQQVADRG